MWEHPRRARIRPTLRSNPRRYRFRPLSLARRGTDMRHMTDGYEDVMLEEVLKRQDTPPKPPNPEGSK